MRFEDACGEARELRLDGWDGRYRVAVSGESLAVTASRLDRDHLNLRIGEDEYQATVLTDGDECFVGMDFGGYEIRRVPLYRSPGEQAEEDFHPVAPMPGRVVAINTAEGQTVEAGEPLLVLEGMKMEYTLVAPVGGVVTAIHFREGDMVEADTPLVDIEPEASQ